MNKPQLAEFDYCQNHSSAQMTAYKHFVEYMLYTSEQTIALGSDWAAPLAELILPHAEYVCEYIGSENILPEVSDLVGPICAQTEPCLP